MMDRLHTLHIDRVFCPTAGRSVPVRLEIPPAPHSADDETEGRLVCLGFARETCRGLCGLTGIPAKAMEARADE